MNDKKQITLRIPDELYKALQKICEVEKVSFNTLLVQAAWSICHQFQAI